MALTCRLGERARRAGGVCSFCNAFAQRRAGDAGGRLRRRDDHEVAGEREEVHPEVAPLAGHRLPGLDAVARHVLHLAAGESVSER
eukprot:SAG31_NODE_4804_length_2947_cov_1.739466_4_plen_86_part_00